MKKKAKDRKKELDKWNIHIVGSADRVVPPRLSTKSSQIFAEPTVVEHDKGHLIPRLGLDEQERVGRFFAQMLAKRARAGPVSSSAL